METSVFSDNAIFPYRKHEKLRFALIVYGVIGFILILGLSYFFFLRNQDIAFFSFFENIILHVKDQIAAATNIGIFYTSTIGGLFFVTIPLEFVFINFLRNGANPFFLIILYIVGFIISFTLNYIIGMKLDNLSKMIISPTKFYKIKGILNRHGPIAIFLFNVIPFLPSQPLSTILGVFKYNKAKFYVYFILGQLCKFSVIAIGYVYIFK